jgi:hypothetical protein
VATARPKNIAYQAEVIGPAIERLNETGATVVGALPPLCEAAERIGVVKSAPYIDPSGDSYSVPYSAPSLVTSEAPAVVPAASPRGVGYLDRDGRNYGDA